LGGPGFALFETWDSMLAGSPDNGCPTHSRFLRMSGLSSQSQSERLPALAHFARVGTTEFSPSEPGQLAPAGLSILVSTSTDPPLRLLQGAKPAQFSR